MSARCKKCYRCLQPGSSATAATAQALQRRLCCTCFHPFPLHSRSAFLEIKSGACWWMQVLFRNMTTCHHSVSCYQATAASICLVCSISVRHSPAKRSVSPFLPPPKAHCLQAFGVEVLLFNAGKSHGGGGGLACCEDGGGRQCGFGSPRL